MIARVWRGITSEAQADEYLDYLTATGVKECRAVAGNRGVRVLRRVGDGQAEFLFISLWDSLDAVRAFAGPDVEKAVYYPEDAEYLVELELAVRHYEVAIEV
jgi:heme-degrading monooxygenase HmoA